MPLVLALSAIVPALLLMWYFWARDAYPEPPRVVWTTFAIGVFSVLPVVLVEWPIHRAFANVSEPWTAGLGGAFPSGYPVARIIDVVRDPGEPFARVAAEPVAALNRIREVLMLWSGSEGDQPQAPPSEDAPAEDAPAEDTAPEASPAHLPQPGAAGP